MAHAFFFFIILPFYFDIKSIKKSCFPIKIKYIGFVTVFFDCKFKTFKFLVHIFLTVQ